MAMVPSDGYYILISISINVCQLRPVMVFVSLMHQSVIPAHC